MVANNPVNFIDEKGLKRWWALIGPHAYIIVEVYNECGCVVGYKKIEFGAKYDSYQTWLTLGLYAEGSVAISDTDNPAESGYYNYEMDSSQEEDQFLLEWAHLMQQNHPTYNLPGFNCLVFSNVAWTTGLNNPTQSNGNTTTQSSSGNIDHLILDVHP